MRDWEFVSPNTKKQRFSIFQNIKLSRAGSKSLFLNQTTEVQNPLKFMFVLFRL